MEISQLGNSQEYYDSFSEGEKKFNNLVATISKGFRHQSSFKTVCASVKWGIHYAMNKEEAELEGKFFLSHMEHERFSKMISFEESSLAKTMDKMALDKVGFEQKLYVKQSEADKLTLCNMHSTERPAMCEGDMELDWTTDKKQYDPSKRIKIRVMANEDWNAPDPVSGKRSHKHFDTIILYLHGGGFIAGSSAKSKILTNPFIQETDCPVFSIDYRLAGTCDFPDPLNDCWQSYLWLLHYAPKQLNMSFDHIMVLGDSAGGNLAMSVVTMSILKGVRKPDFLTLLYPAMGISRDSFGPSILLALDDPLLRAAFVDRVCEQYTDPIKGVDMTKEFFVNPSATPDHLLRQFPPIKMAIAGLDPLRDQSLRMLHRMINLGVNVQAKEYKYMIHNFGNMGVKSAFGLSDCDKAVQEIIKMTKEGLDKIQNPFFYE